MSEHTQNVIGLTVIGLTMFAWIWLQLRGDARKVLKQVRRHHDGVEAALKKSLATCQDDHAATRRRLRAQIRRTRRCRRHWHEASGRAEHLRTHFGTAGDACVATWACLDEQTRRSHISHGLAWQPPVGSPIT